MTGSGKVYKLEHFAPSSLFLTLNLLYSSLSNIYWTSEQVTKWVLFTYLLIHLHSFKSLAGILLPLYEFLSYLISSTALSPPPSCGRKKQHQQLHSFCDNWTEESLVHFPVRHPAAGSISARDHYFEWCIKGRSLPLCTATFSILPFVNAENPICYHNTSPVRPTWPSTILTLSCRWVWRIKGTNPSVQTSGKEMRHWLLSN